MTDILQALLFGVVEGITEWLPISSTGHMMLVNQFFPMNVSEGFYATFLVVIQLGAICAVILQYFAKLNPFAKTKSTDERRMTWDIWLKIIVGTIPAGIVGLLLDDVLEERVMNNPDVAYIVVSIALIVYGAIFIVLERGRGIMRPATRGKHAVQTAKTAKVGALVPTRPQPRALPAGQARSGKFGAKEPLFMLPGKVANPIDSFADLSFVKAFIIGCFQSLAVIPGTSRSGSIIIGSMLVGTSRALATEFAFFLAIPVMLGWSVVKLIKHGLAFTGAEWLILGIGMLSAFFVSIVVIRFLISYVKKHDFAAFGVYRIVLALVVLGYFGLIAA